jgi:hypothetical protein
MRQPAFAGIFPQTSLKVPITPGGELAVERASKGDARSWDSSTDRIRALLYAGKPNWRVLGSIVVR